MGVVGILLVGLVIMVDGFVEIGVVEVVLMGVDGFVVFVVVGIESVGVLEVGVVVVDVFGVVFCVVCCKVF